MHGILASLAAVDEAFEEAVSTLDTARQAVQSLLETLTRATASPEEIAEVLRRTITAIKTYSSHTSLLLRDISYFLSFISEFSIGTDLLCRHTTASDKSLLIVKGKNISQ